MKKHIVENKLTVGDLLKQMCIHPDCKTREECEKKEIASRCKPKCQQQAKKTLTTHERK